MTSTGKPLKVGLIGCGRVTQTRHLPVLSRLAEAEVIALADIDAERLQRVADRFGIKHRYAGVHDLVDNPAIDAVGVCVPAHGHVDVAVAALEAGKHVFIEKPLALSLQECDRLIACAQRCGQTVMVGFNLRWNHLIQQTRDLLKQKLLGPVSLIRTTHTGNHESVPEWRRRRTHGGGVLFEQAVHHVDLWRFLLHSEVKTVFATSQSGEWDDESVSLTAWMENGVVATSVFSERTSASNAVEIHGRKGRLEVSCYQFDGLRFYPLASVPGSMRLRLKHLAQLGATLPQAFAMLRNGGAHLASFRAEWQHFTRAIHDQREAECSLEDGKRALQIILAAMSSAETGRPVDVAQAPPTITPVSAA